MIYIYENKYKILRFLFPVQKSGETRHVKACKRDNIEIYYTIVKQKETKY